MRMMKLRGAASLIALAVVFAVLVGDARALADGRRLYGSVREATAVAISRDGWPDGSDDAVLVNGYTFADALAAGPLAKLLDAPILLTQKDTLPKITKDEMDRLGVKMVYIIGDTSVVSYAVENATGRSVKRIAGRDRYETAAAVAQEIKRMGGPTDSVVLARGDDYADALAAVAVQDVMPVLFAGKGGAKRLHTATARLLGTLGVKNIFAVGGADVVSDEALAQAYSIIGSANRYPVRLSGRTRYDTALAIADFFKPAGGYKGAVLARGDDFADALAGGPYAAKKGYTLIMVNNGSSDLLPDAAKSFIKANDGIEADAVVALGGPDVVPYEALEAAVDAATANELNVIDVY